MWVPVTHPADWFVPVVLLAASVSTFGIAVQVLVNLPTLFDTPATQLHEALAWAIAAGVMTAFCVLVSAVPAIIPRHFALPVFFELFWTVSSPVVDLSTSVFWTPQPCSHISSRGRTGQPAIDSVLQRVVAEYSSRSGVCLLWDGRCPQPNHDLAVRIL
jgi:predicted anti-sigma-YlaC factor YlaD